MNKYNLLLLLLTTISIALHLVNLNYPQEFYFDENYTTFTAVKLAKGAGKNVWQPTTKPIDPPRGYEWQHPPLARTLIASTILLLGNKPWVWRLSSAIAGILSIPLIYALGKIYFSHKVGIIAAFLLTFDGLSFSLSRIATRDSLLILFILTSLYLLLNSQFLASTIFIGFALATKWSAISLLPLLLLNHLFVIQNNKNTPSPLSKFTKNLTSQLLLMTLIPILIYIFTYIPYLTLGSSLSDLFLLQKKMFTHMSSHAFRLTNIHPHHSLWWSWPLGLKPIGYFINKQHQLWAMPNLLVFWLGLFALILQILRLIRHKTKAAKMKWFYQQILVLAGYFLFMLPWILISLINPHTSASYIHYYLPSLTFLHLITAHWLSQQLQKKNNLPRAISVTILIIIPLIFLAIYPHLVGL